MYSNHIKYCCGIPITSVTKLCYICQFDKIVEICNLVTPTFQLNLLQCLRCLAKIENNLACTCSPCETCAMYLPSDKPHRCSKRMMICKKCNYTISSYSKKCLLCESKSKNLICKKCPLTFSEEKKTYLLFLHKHKY